MYVAWIQLSFDSSKDDIEELINEEKSLAKRLGYNELAQVMVIKNHLLLELYYNCLTINNLKDLTNFLVKVYDNPEMKEKLGIRDQAAGAARDTTHAFSMGQSMDTNVMDSSSEIGNLKAEIGELKYRMCITTSESKTREQKYKPKITPPGRRGGNFVEVDHLKIEARVDKMQETTEGIKAMVDSDLGVRISIIGVT